MIFMPSESCFFSGYTFEFFLGSFGVATLEAFPLEIVLAANVFHWFAGISISIAIHGDLSDTKVNAKEVGSDDWFMGNSLDLHMEVIITISVFNQLSRCRLLALESGSLKFTKTSNDAFSTIKQSQTEAPVFLAEREDPGIIVDASWRENVIIFFLHLESGTNASYCPYSQISRQLEFATNGVVASLLDLELAGRICLAANFRDAIASSSERQKRSVNLDNLLWRRHQLAYNCPNRFHLENFIATG